MVQSTWSGVFTWVFAGVVVTCVACSGDTKPAPGGTGAVDPKVDASTTLPDTKHDGGKPPVVEGGGPIVKDAAPGEVDAAEIELDAGPCADVSFAAVVQPILTASCDGTDCHINNQQHPSALNLATGKAYAQLVNVGTPSCGDGRKRVVPGNASSSYIIQKLTGKNICDGERMPKDGSPLPAASIKSIADWICSGAKNN